MKTYEKHSSTFANMDGNVVAMIGYLAISFFGWLGFAAAIFLFFIEKKSGLVKFHLAQGILLRIVYSFFTWVLTFVITLGNLGRGYYSYSYRMGGFRSLFHWGSNLALELVNLAIILLFTALSIWCAVKAYYGQDWQIPLLGSLAMTISKSWSPAAYYGEGPVPPGCEPGPIQGFGNTPYGNPNQTPPTNNPNQPPFNNGQTQYPQGGANVPYGNNQGGPAPVSPTYGQQNVPPVAPYGQQPASPNGQPPVAPNAGNYTPQEQAQQAPAPQAPAPQQTEEKPSDPNAQLPPEMRDPPQPKDMD